MNTTVQTMQEMITKMFVLLYSDTLVSKIDPVETNAFDASQIKELTPDILTDLVALTELGVDSSDFHSCHKAKDENEKSDSKDSSTAKSSYSVIATTDTDGKSLSRVPSVEINLSRASSLSLCSSELDGVIGSLIKTCALKALAVLINNSRIMDQLVLNRNDCEMIEVLKKVMNCMVGCAVLPSPVRRVVNLGELERAQTVLLKMASTSSKKIEQKESQEIKGE